MSKTFEDDSLRPTSGVEAQTFQVLKKIFDGNKGSFLRTFVKDIVPMLVRQDLYGKMARRVAKKLIKAKVIDQTDLEVMKSIRDRIDKQQQA